MNLISFVTKEIITVKYIVSYSLFIFIIENKKKNKKKKLIITSFYSPSKEIRLANSQKRICKTQSRFFIFLKAREIKKVLTKLQNISAFLTMPHLQAESRMGFSYIRDIVS